jgi:isoleucyl-tRNA synthetase
MEIFFTILVAIVCIAFIYFAFKHVIAHEKIDANVGKKLSKKVKSKNK